MNEARKISFSGAMLFSRVEGKDRYPDEIALRPSLTKFYDLVIRKLLSTDTTILITGESGVGKEVMAQIIHQQSSRKDNSFHTIDISVGPESLVESELFGHEKGAFTGALYTRIGILEEADGGTVFLDEVGNISLSLQAKLLRTLENKTFRKVGGNKVIKSNFRLICATNKNLSEEVKDGRFREDLFYRLSTMPINIPPLRNYPQDIMKLSEFFMYDYFKNLNTKKIIYSGIIKDKFERYSWPGNIRELKNKIERLLILYDDKISFDFIMNMDVIADDAKQNNQKMAERERVINALIKADWKKTTATKSYGCCRKQFYILMKRYGIPLKRPKSAFMVTK